MGLERGGGVGKGNIRDGCSRRKGVTKDRFWCGLDTGGGGWWG